MNLRINDKLNTQLTKNAYSLRAGALAKKLGMLTMRVDGAAHAVTFLNLENCKVLAHITKQARGYDAVLVGIGHKKNLNKPQIKDFEKKGYENYAKLKEFRVNTFDGSLESGTELKADYFAIGQFVNVSAVSKGKSFQGGMKRHGFHGLRATHGVSVSHRSLGSTGNRTEPGRVFPGKKMPGRMGGTRVTTHDLKVIYVNAEKNVVGVIGCVPGFDGALVEIRDSWK